MSEVLTQEVARLNQRIAELEEKLVIATGGLSQNGLGQGVVEHIAHQIQHLFNNPVMLSSIASALLATMQNALAFRAGASKDRQSQLVVIGKYVPGSLRAMVTEEGALVVEEPVQGEGEQENDVVAWKELEFDEELRADTHQAIRSILDEHGIDAGRHYFLIDDITLQRHREDARRLLEEATERRVREEALRTADAAAQPVVEG